LHKKKKQLLGILEFFSNKEFEKDLEVLELIEKILD